MEESHKIWTETLSAGNHISLKKLANISLHTVTVNFKPFPQFMLKNTKRQKKKMPWRQTREREGKKVLNATSL